MEKRGLTFEGSDFRHRYRRQGDHIRAGRTICEDGRSIGRTRPTLVRRGRRRILPVREIREMCVFSVQSVTRDAPFSKLDLISCRNLLIYMDADLQDRVLETFRYALKPAGLLFLGPSEGATRQANYFAAPTRSTASSSARMSIRGFRSFRLVSQLSSRPPRQAVPAPARATTVSREKPIKPWSGTPRLG